MRTQTPAHQLKTIWAQSIRAILLLAVLGPAQSGQAEIAAFISQGTVWKYSDTGNDLGTAWRARTYDDRAWTSGPSQLGFGDGDEATQLTAGHVTYYFRRSFVVTNVGAIGNLSARLVYDDGAVVYVNGVEAFRIAMPAGPVTYTTVAEGVTPDNAVHEASLSPGLLVNGINVVAVEIHQANSASSDLSFDLTLTAETNAPPRQPRYAVTDLGVLAGRVFSYAEALNDQGWVVGGSGFPDDDEGQASLFASGAVISVPISNCLESLAFDINNQGVALARCAAGAEEDEYFLFSNGVVRSVQALTGDSHFTPEFVTDEGWLIGLRGGQATLFRDGQMTFLTGAPGWGIVSNVVWQGGAYRNGVPVDLATLPGTDYTVAYGINDHGAIVGFAADHQPDGGYEERAIVQENDQVSDLNALIPTNSGWFLESARDINNRGQIVGYGRHNDQLRGYFLTPTPPTWTNRPPSVTFVTPTNGETFAAPAQITLVAQAQDCDGFMTIRTVEFFLGTLRLAVTTNLPTADPRGPFVWTWSGVPPNQYMLRAHVMDDAGGAAWAAPVHVSVWPSNMAIVSITASDAVADEAPASNPDAHDAVFTVQRRGPRGEPIVHGPLSVFYTISGSASNGLDYARLAGHVPFAEGASNATVRVTPLDDDLVEGTETVTLTLQPSPPSYLPNPYVVGAPSVATAEILDNDPAPDLLRGVLRKEVYLDIPGVALSNLVHDPKFPDHPDRIEWIQDFEIPLDLDVNVDNYGARLTGFLVPPETGDYTFYLSSDDEGALYLSTDENPAHLTLIASEPAWSQPRQWNGPAEGRTNRENISVPIPLEAGRLYYVEALMKEGGGGDHLGVTWALPGQPEPANGSPPIPGEFLATWRSPGVVPPRILEPPCDLTRFAGQSGTFTVVAEGTPPLSYQWWKDGTALPGQTNDVLSFSSMQPEQNGEYTVTVNNSFGSAASAAARVKVFPSSHPDVGITWVANIPGAYEEPVLFVDRAGHAYVAGNLQVVKFAPDGQCLWTAPYDRPGGGEGGQGWPGALTVDAAGQVYVTGCTREPAGGYNFTTIKLSAAGERLWAAHSGRPTSRDLPVGIGVDTAGNVLIYGTSGGIAMLVKYDAAGHELWAVDPTNPDENLQSVAWAVEPASHKLQVANAPALVGGPQCRELAVDPAGHAHVFGSVSTGPSDAAGVTIKCDTEGYPLWTARYEGASPGALTLDRDGNVFVTGTIKTNNKLGLITLKYTPEGALCWVAQDFHPLTSGRSSQGIVLGPAGSVYVIGNGWASEGNEEAIGFATLKFDASGQAIWAARLVGTYNGGRGLAVDETGNAYITTSLGEYLTREQPVTIKYDTDGNPLWAMPFPPDGDWGRLATLALDAAANVYVLGKAANDTEGYHYVLVKYAQLNQPPVITRQPTSLTRFVGQTAVFSVGATGTAPLCYQWQYYGTPIAGATNATLTLEHLQLAQAGGYTVVISNAAGTVTSAEATLAVLPAPTGPGSLDLTFDPTRGGEVIGPASESGEVVALARQPDGKLVIGGQFSGYNGSLRRHIARIHPNGALDEGFNPGLGVDGHVYAVALQPNGQMLMGGSFSVFDTQPCSSLVRLNPDGSLDTGFSAALARYGTPGMVRVIVVQGDGKILVGGSFSEVNGVARTNVARLNPDGSLDAGFVPASGAPDWYQGVVSLSVLADGKLLVGGRFLGGRKLLCRLLPDGSLDSSFATELTGYELAQFAVRSDGKIYAAGPFDLDRPGWYYSRLVLLNADGTIDSSFAVDFGEVGFSCFTTLAVDSDDRVLVTGWFRSVNGVSRNHVARINPDGSVDPTFDPADTLGEWYPTTDARFIVEEPSGHFWLGGLAHLTDGTPVSLVRLQTNGQFDEAFYMAAGEVDVAGHSVSIQALAALPDGRVYVGGEFTSFNHQPRTNLARLLPDGTLDTSFDPAWSNLFAVSLLTLQPDGNLLAGSSSELVRFHPDGGLDPSFVGHLHDTLGMRILCLALQADGKIVIGGEFADGLARLNPDGSLDDTFQPPYLPAYDADAVQALTVQPDGKILYGGNGAIGLQRLYPDGSVDPTFNCGTVIGHVFDILVQSDGSILVGGRPCLRIGDEARGLARLHPDGRVDETFNAPLGDYVDAVTVAPDGHIFATAPEIVGGWPTRIYRLDPDGTVDPTFQARLGPVYGPPVVAALLVQSDGQVLIGGTFTSVNGVPVDGLAQLNNDLTVPTTFVQREIASSGNIRLVALPSMHVSVYAVEDQPPAGWPVTSISHGGVFDPHTGKVKFGPFYDYEARTLTYQVTLPVWGVHCALGVFCFSGQASADGINSPVGGPSCLALAGYHPADVNPANLQISIGEVTAYGAAWRCGSNWDCHAQGIPINYVTRAAALWRAGECYTVDAAITNEPLWWVSCDVPRSADSQLAVSQVVNLPAAQRQMADAFVPSEPLVITLSIAPANSRAYAVEERIPVGWAVSAISDGGEFDAVNTKVKWGPVWDGLPRTLSYVTTPPPRATGPAAFAGVSSFDGTSLEIAGPQNLSEGCRLEAAFQASPGQFQFALAGRLGAVFRIETSSDLVTWTEWTTVTSVSGRHWLQIPIPPGPGQRYFRARLAE